MIDEISVSRFNRLDERKFVLAHVKQQGNLVDGTCFVVEQARCQVASTCLPRSPGDLGKADRGTSVASSRSSAF